jgi:hypothetical protein
MLLSEIVYNIKNLLAGGIESDDENLSNAQVAFMIGYYRAKLFKQDRQKGRSSREQWVQNLGQVQVQMADKNECCDIDACIIRTVNKVPRPIETDFALNLTFVGNLNGKPYIKDTHNGVYWSHANKYTGAETRWYYQNGYVYIVNPPTLMLEHINIQGIFEEPLVAESFRTCDCPNTDDCVDLDSLNFEYKMPLHYVDLIVKMVAETELRILASMPTDVSNDSLDQVSRYAGGK